MDYARLASQDKIAGQMDYAGNLKRIFYICRRSNGCQE